MIRFIPEAEALYSEKMINILAAAWDTDGNLAGVRSLYSDFYSRMDITVYSIGPAIDRVELYLEAY